MQKAEKITKLYAVISVFLSVIRFFISEKNTGLPPIVFTSKCEIQRAYSNYLVPLPAEMAGQSKFALSAGLNSTLLKV